MVNSPKNTEDVRTHSLDATREIDTPAHPLPTPRSDLPLKKTSSKKRWFIVLITVIIVAFVVGVSLFLVNVRETAKKNESDTKSSAATQFTSADSVMSKAQENLSGTELPLLLKDGQGGKTSDGYVVYTVPVYKVGERNYNNFPTKSDGIAYKGDSTTAEADYTRLTDFFENNKFKLLRSANSESSPLSWTDTRISPISYAVYESNDQLCAVWHGDATSSSLGSHIASVGCGDKADYEKSAEAIDTFYAAYNNGKDTPTANTTYGVIDAGVGADGYEYAVLYQEDSSQSDTHFRGFYYKEAGKHTWTFFAGSESLISCSKYNTEALKKAFKGFDCHNDTTKTTAKVS